MSKAVLVLTMVLALCPNAARAQNNGGISGTWLATKTGNDPENMSERQLNETVYWVIKKNGDQVRVDIYVETMSGSVIPAFNLITGVSYSGGTLYVSSEPPPSPMDAFTKLATYYEIPMYSGKSSVLGTYTVQSTFVASIGVGQALGIPLSPSTSVAAGGNISLIKQSNATGKPVARPRPKQLPGMAPLAPPPSFNPYYAPPMFMPY